MNCSEPTRFNQKRAIRLTASNRILGIWSSSTIELEIRSLDKSSSKSEFERSGRARNLSSKREIMHESNALDTTFKGRMRTDEAREAISV